MKELWEQSILPYNLPLTILLGLVVLFWLRAIIGGGEDLLEGNADGGDDFGDSFGFLRILNAGAVPLTMVLSILILTLWMGAVALNYYFNAGHDYLWALVLDAGALVLALIATKVITQPLAVVMRRLKAAEDAPPVVGETGIVRSLELNATHGQVEVERPDGAPALLNARLADGSGPVPRGTRVWIDGIDESSGIYLASSLPESRLSSEIETASKTHPA